MKKTIDFSKYSSIKIGPTIDVHMIESCDDIIKEGYIIGSCSNILVGNNPPPLMMLSKKLDFIEIQNDRLVIGAATPSGKIASFCKKHDIAAFEFLSHLPGKLGGLIKMNAGLKEYEIFNDLISITTCKGEITKENIDYGYRYTKIDDIVLAATFTLKHGYDENKVALFKRMRLNQPSTPSAGSCFKNPPGDYAGRLIEAVDLKGKRLGGMGWSGVHANFLVNYSKGTFEEAIALIEEVQTKVIKTFGIRLEREVIILDTDYI